MASLSSWSVRRLIVYNLLYIPISLKQGKKSQAERANQNDVTIIATDVTATKIVVLKPLGLSAPPFKTLKFNLDNFDRLSCF